MKSELNVLKNNEIEISNICIEMTYNKIYYLEKELKRLKSKKFISFKYKSFSEEKIEKIEYKILELYNKIEEELNYKYKL